MIIRADFSKSLDLSYLLRNLSNAIETNKKREFQVVFSRFRVYFSINQPFSQPNCGESFVSLVNNYQNVALISCMEEVDGTLKFLDKEDDRINKLDFFKDEIFSKSLYTCGMLKISSKEDAEHITNVFVKAIEKFFKLQKMAAFWE